MRFWRAQGVETKMEGPFRVRQSGPPPSSKANSYKLGARSAPKKIGHDWSEFFCANLRLIIWNLFWPIFLLHHWVEPNPAFTSQIWSSKFGATIARCENVEMGMCMSFPRFGRRMWDVDAAVHAHVFHLFASCNSCPKFGAPNLGCKCRVGFKSMMDQKDWQKKGFKILASNSKRHRFQRCPNCFWRVICAEDKMDVESRPHFLFLGLQVSNLHPALKTRICKTPYCEGHLFTWKALGIQWIEKTSFGEK